MSTHSEKNNLERMNKDLHMTIEHTLKELTNEIIAWAAFADRHNPNDVKLDTDLANTEYLELLNTIETDVKKHIKININNFDFSTYYSTEDSINSFLTAFLSESENREFVNIILNHKKNTFLFMAAATILYREASLLAFANSHYYMAMRLHNLCKGLHSQMEFANLQFMENFKQELSRRNRKPNDVRWKGRVEKLRRKYLELDERRRNEMGNDISIKKVATWIHQYHNKEDLEFETIRDHLSKARKGVFTNK